MSDRILITGGSGFVGTNLVEHYRAQGRDVLNLDSKSPLDARLNSLYRNCDINDRDKVMREVTDFKPSFVIHLAARTDLDGKTAEDYRTNTDGAQNVVDAVNSVGTVQRAMYASSRLVFEISHRPSHDYDYKPTTPYGESKVGTERIVKAQSADSVPWVLFRPTSIWGEWFDIPYKTFFLTVVRGRYMHPGNVQLLKSYGYVGNAVFELDRLLNAPKESFDGKVYFIADYPPLDVLEWGSLIAKAAGCPPIKKVPRQLLRVLAVLGDGAKAAGMRNPPLTSFRLNNLLTPLVYDLSREEKLFGNLPFSLAEGVERTVRWMRDHGQI